MDIISHRGNLDGSNPYRENHPDYIDETITALNPCKYLGPVVKVDVWGETNTKYRHIHDGLFLGNDAPSHKVSEDWLRERNKDLILHCRNMEAVEYILLARNLRGLDVEWFWHENDTMTLTSRGKMWQSPSNQSAIGISVWLGKPSSDTPRMGGICTDHPLAWRKFRLDKINEWQKFVLEEKSKTTKESGLS